MLIAVEENTSATSVFTEGVLVYIISLSVKWAM